MTDKMQEAGTFTFERDTKTYHRFLVETPGGVTGTLYVPKTMDPLPKRLTLEMAKAQDSRN